MSNSSITSFIVCLCVLTTVVVNYVDSRALDCDASIQRMDKCMEALLFADRPLPFDMNYLKNDYCPQMKRRTKCMVEPRPCFNSKC